MLKRDFDKNLLKETDRHRDNNLEEKSKEKSKTNKAVQLKLKIRFDYKGKQKQAKFFWGGKNPDDASHEAREQYVSMWRNIPMQGIDVEKIDLGEIYQVYDEEIEENISYAPLEIIVRADSLEELLPFVVKEEFRRVDVIEPESLTLSGKGIEKLVFKINKQFKEELHQKLKEIK